MAFTDYSTTAANNNSASPDGAPEGMAPSGVNNTIRQIMSDTRSSVAAVVNTEAALTALTEKGGYAIVLGSSAVGDQSPVVFRWDSASSATANGTTSLRPDDIIAGAPGRWLSHEGVKIDASVTTTGNVFDVAEANALTSGRCARFTSTSVDTTDRGLVRIEQATAAATNTTLLDLRQAAANGFIDFIATASAVSTTPISTLTSSNATTHHIKIQVNGMDAWVAVSTTAPG